MVITGLTRNQFAGNTAQGFESLTLRQIETPPFWVVFLFGHIVGFEVDLQKRKVSVAAFLGAICRWHIAFGRGESLTLRQKGTPPFWVVFLFLISFAIS